MSPLAMVEQSAWSRHDNLRHDNKRKALVLNLMAAIAASGFVADSNSTQHVKDLERELTRRHNDDSVQSLGCVFQSLEQWDYIGERFS